MILRASSLNPNESPTLRVASECQKVSKPDAGEAITATSMNNTTALRNMFQSPADRLEQDQLRLPMLVRRLHMVGHRWVKIWRCDMAAAVGLGTQCASMLHYSFQAHTV